MLNRMVVGRGWWRRVEIDSGKTGWGGSPCVHDQSACDAGAERYVGGLDGYVAVVLFASYPPLSGRGLDSLLRCRVRSQLAQAFRFTSAHWWAGSHELDGRALDTRTLVFARQDEATFDVLAEGPGY